MPLVWQQPSKNGALLALMSHAVLTELDALSITVYAVNHAHLNAVISRDAAA